jgi:hypothetical protein
MMKLWTRPTTAVLVIAEQIEKIITTKLKLFFYFRKQYTKIRSEIEEIHHGMEILNMLEQISYEWEEIHQIRS